MKMADKKLKELIAQYCNVKAEDITDGMRFREDLEFSSLDFMAFLGELEDELDMEADEEEVLKIRTVGEAASYIANIEAAV